MPSFFFKKNTISETQIAFLKRSFSFFLSNRKRQTFPIYVSHLILSLVFSPGPDLQVPLGAGVHDDGGGGVADGQGARAKGAEGAGPAWATEKNIYVK